MDGHGFCESRHGLRGICAARHTFFDLSSICCLLLCQIKQTHARLDLQSQTLWSIPYKLEKRVFPFRYKIAMILVMSSTLVFTYIATSNIKAVIFSGAFMALVAAWAWRFPSSVAEHDTRKAQGKRIGWIR